VVVQPFELTSSAINKRLQNTFEWMVFIERVGPMPPNQQETSHVISSMMMGLPTL
jgi:hypothetical protein